MAEALHMELSKTLFPPALVARVVHALSDRLQVEVETEDKEMQLLRFIGPETDPGVAELFRETLTLEATLFWSSVDKPPARRPASSPSRTDCTWRLVADENQTTILLATNLAVHRPASVIGALRPLLGRAQVLVESTNPIDRLLILIRPRSAEMATALMGDLLAGLRD